MNNKTVWMPLLALLACFPAGAAAAQGQLIAAAGDVSCTPPNPEYNNGIGICIFVATSNAWRMSL